MEATAVVRALFTAFAGRDPSGVRELVAPDCRFWPQGTAEAVGRKEEYVGPDGMVEFFADASRAWEELEIVATDVRSVGTGVICFGVAIGRLAGETTEQRIPVIWVFRLRAGQIAYGRAAATAAEAAELVRTED